MKIARYSHIFLACFAALLAVAPFATAEQEVPAELTNVDIKPTLGSSVPLSLRFTDHHGNQVSLQKYFLSGKPVILTLNYFSCPGLCNLILDGLVTGLLDPATHFSIGQDFEVITVSIDPTDKPETAKARRDMYLQSLSKPVDTANWSFLVGAESDIQVLTSAVGFQYRYDKETKQYGHAAGIFILTPDGHLSQVLYGIEYPGRELRLSLTEASSGSIGSPLDKILLWCYHYDSKERKYTPWAQGMMRIAAVLTILGLGGFLIKMWRAERRKVSYE